MFKRSYILGAALACNVWLALLVSEEQALASPLPDVFLCYSGQTIGQVLVCDGSVDCADGSDEAVCATEADRLQNSAMTSSAPNPTHTHSSTAPPLTTPGRRLSKKEIGSIVLVASLFFGVLFVVVLALIWDHQSPADLEADHEHIPGVNDPLLPPPVPSPGPGTGESRAEDVDQPTRPARTSRGLTVDTRRRSSVSTLGIPSYGTNQLAIRTGVPSSV